jgi:hypothetical protein
MEEYKTYEPLKSPIAMNIGRPKRLTWQYKAGPVLNTIRRSLLKDPVSLQILFYVSVIKASAMS